MSGEEHAGVAPAPHGLREAWFAKGTDHWGFGADWGGASGFVRTWHYADCAAGAGTCSECGAYFVGSSGSAVAGCGVGIRCGGPLGRGERGGTLDRREKEGDSRESRTGNAEPGCGV